ncbi:hypothetical protein L915_01458 [Phytophthora nicotianae]|uniref:Enoyl reductase (ER) domain-containing protein n=1 Tax=Phytophthora nicotianae TaxID=4792 RepID=W2HMD1_PHYNI|nr:hypothetical protein L915_01458 [Phytophthora nicotianae]
MDEATANVDQESDKLIQQTMKESFGGGDSTVLCIAHRIETIMDSDKILVLDAGKVVEYDTPSALLQIKGGIFKSLRLIYSSPQLQEMSTAPRTVNAYAAFEPCGKIEPFQYLSRPLGEDDVEIKISHCGICGVDIHHLDSGWEPTLYPCVFGHEIICEVSVVGINVKHLGVGDRVGVGAQTLTMRSTRTYGGYADYVRVDSNFAFKIPDNIPSASAAPLLCADVAVYTPLKRHVKPGDRVGVIGISGLGHLAIQFIRALGATPVAFSRSESKEKEIRALGAEEFYNLSDPDHQKKSENSVNVVLLTADTTNMPYNTYLTLVKKRGTGIKWVGSIIGSIQDVEYMLNLASEKNVRAIVQQMPMDKAVVLLDIVTGINLPHFVCSIFEFPVCIDMSESSVEHQLLRLHVLLGDDEAQLEAVYKSFQDLDHEGRGSLENAPELELVLREHLSSKDLKKIDIEALVNRFSTAENCFDYKAFCTALQQPPVLQSESSHSGRRSPTKRRSRSPVKTRMRMDKQLESQRLLMESVRQKLIRGVQGDDSDGFEGIQNILRRLDTSGEGYLDVKVFSKKVLQHLKAPLTRPEREFLLEQLKQSSEMGQELINYEQLGRVCNLNSDDSASESDMEQELQTKALSPSKSSQLGAKFLAAEKRLNEFLRTPIAEKSSSISADTPRCLVTGAEKFLELAEAIDQDNTGLLYEDDATAKTRNIIEGDENSRDLFSTYWHGLPFLFQSGSVSCTNDSRNTIANCMAPSNIQYQLKGRSAVLKLTTDEAAQVTSLFLHSSSKNSTSHLHYREFLTFVDECSQVSRPPAIDTKLVPSTPEVSPPASPKATKLPQPEPADPASDISVGDYLMFHALPQERRNFEDLMEMLKHFQNTVDGNHEPAIQRIANGIMMPLGKRLRVKVQFSIGE